MMIRDATPDDLPALVALGARMLAESPRFSRLVFSPERLAATLDGLIGQPRGFVMVAERGGELFGVMVAALAQHWCSADIVAHDLALFVPPEHRGALVASRLIRAYRQWAQGSGAKLINAGVTTGVLTENTTRLYECCGFTRCGTFLEA